MRYQPLPADLYQSNRERLYSQLPPRSLIILQANDILPTNADGSMGFVTNSDLFYLSGIDQEETILMLFPGAADPKQRELLFVRETSELIAVWEGKNSRRSRPPALRHPARPLAHGLRDAFPPAHVPV